MIDSYQMPFFSTTQTDEKKRHEDKKINKDRCVHPMHRFCMMLDFQLIFYLQPLIKEIERDQL